MIVVLLFVSCSKSNIGIDDPIIPKHSNVIMLSEDESKAFKINTTNRVRISETDAINMTKSFFFDKNKTKSNDDFTVISCKTVSNGTKSVNDVSYYEIKFSSGGEYYSALTSSDERVPSVFACFSNGSLDDTLSNNGLQLYTRMLSNYIVNEIEEFDISYDSLYKSAVSKIGYNTKAIPPTTSGDWNYLGEQSDVTRATIEKKVKVKWGQNAPFNANMPYVYGIATQNGRAYVGCVMVATAQILSYHKRNFGSYITYNDWINFDNVYNNWVGSGQYQYPCDYKVQQLMRDIYDRTPNAKIKPDGTQAEIHDAKNYLISIGFNAATTCDYDFNKLIDALQYGPTMIGGRRGRGLSGHAWVVDGAETITMEVYDLYQLEYNGQLLEMKDLKRVLTNRYLRYNWGYEGRADGWFSDAVFGVANNNGLTFDYSYDVKIIPMIN